MNEKVAPLLNAIADQAKKNDAKSKSQKYKSNGIHLAEMNRNNDVHPAADVQPLIVFGMFSTLPPILLGSFSSNVFFFCIYQIKTMLIMEKRTLSDLIRHKIKRIMWKK